MPAQFGRDFAMLEHRPDFVIVIMSLKGEDRHPTFDRKLAGRNFEHLFQLWQLCFGRLPDFGQFFLAHVAIEQEVLGLGVVGRHVGQNQSPILLGQKRAIAAQLLVGRRSCPRHRHQPRQRHAGVGAVELGSSGNPGFDLGDRFRRQRRFAIRHPFAFGGPLQLFDQQAAGRIARHDRRSGGATLHQPREGVHTQLAARVAVAVADDAVFHQDRSNVA